MKTQHTSLYSLVMGGALLALAAPAQEGNRPPPPGGPEGRGNPGEMIKRADTDNDGKVSKDEFVKARTSEMETLFGRLDGNSDGFIDEAEMKSMAERMRGERGGPEGMRRPDGEGGFRRPPEGEGRPDGMRRPPEGEERPEGMRRPEGRPDGEGMRRPEGGPPGGERGNFMGDQAFSRLDANGDGSLSKDEFEQGMARMREMFRGGMGRGEGGPGGFRGPGGPEGRGPGGEGGFRRPPSQGEGEGRQRPPLEGEAPKKEGEAPKNEEGKKEGA